MKVPSPPRGRSERWARRAEWALLLALVIALAVANVKMLLMLERMGVEWTRGLPASLLFLGVGYLVIRRFRCVSESLRRGGEDG